MALPKGSLTMDPGKKAPPTHQGEPCAACHCLLQIRWRYLAFVAPEPVFVGIREMRQQLLAFRYLYVQSLRYARLPPPTYQGEPCAAPRIVDGR